MNPRKSSSLSALFLSFIFLSFALSAHAVPIPSGPGSDITCPINNVKLDACVDLLGGRLGVRTGANQPPPQRCCSAVQGLVDVELAVCLCTVVKANVLGIVNLDIPLSLNLLLHTCGLHAPHGFHCV